MAGDQAAQVGDLVRDRVISLNGHGDYPLRL